MQKAVHSMENKVDIQCNKIFHLEDLMVMYGIYNSDTLEDLINTVQNYIIRLLRMKNCLPDRQKIGTHYQEV